MENNDQLKPLSFETEEALKPLSFDFQNDIKEDFVPIAKTISNDIRNKDSNFVFFFGTRIGKICDPLFHALLSKVICGSFKTQTGNSKF